MIEKNIKGSGTSLDNEKDLDPVLSKVPTSFSSDIDFSELDELDLLNEIDEAVDNLEDKDGEGISFPKFESFKDYNSFMDNEVARTRLTPPPFTINPITFILYRVIYHVDSDTYVRIYFILGKICAWLSLITAVLGFIGTLIMRHMLFLHVIQALSILTVLTILANTAVLKYINKTLLELLYKRHINSQNKVEKLDQLVEELKAKKNKN